MYISNRNKNRKIEKYFTLYELHLLYGRLSNIFHLSIFLIIILIVYVLQTRGVFLLAFIRRNYHTAHAKLPHPESSFDIVRPLSINCKLESEQCACMLYSNTGYRRPRYPQSSVHQHKTISLRSRAKHRPLHRKNKESAGRHFRTLQYGCSGRRKGKYLERI